MIPGADPTPLRVAENLRAWQAASEAPLEAYWLTLTGERDRFRRELQELVRADGLIVLVVRQVGFDNPDALMQDLLTLMEAEANRQVLADEAAAVAAAGGRLGLVLLSRRALAMSQSSSPITWPDWVPGVGRRQVVCHIREVSRRIVAPLDCDESGAWQLNVRLLAVEEALIRRLTAAYQRDAAAGERFFAHIRRRTDRPWAGFLAEAARDAASVRNDRGYRPDSRSGEPVVSRLWRAAQSLSAAELRLLEVDLAGALVPDDAKLLYRDAALLTILSRPDGSKGTLTRRFARDLVAAVNLACQYVTCVAHYDKYQRYPIVLMASVVDDLQRALAELEGALNDLHDGGEPQDGNELHGGNALHGGNELHGGNALDDGNELHGRNELRDLNGLRGGRDPADEGRLARGGGARGSGDG